jgi:ERCC4-type nuclease
MPEKLHEQAEWARLRVVQALPSCIGGGGMKSPFTIVCDTREKRAFNFDAITERRRGEDVPIDVGVVRAGLKTGDYSVQGCEAQLTIERKSVKDLVQTIFHGRRRFVRELERMQEMMCACVLVEGDWLAVMRHTHGNTQGNPKSVDASMMAWSIRFPKVHWHFRPSRYYAERSCYRLLSSFYKEVKKQDA